MKTVSAYPKITEAILKVSFYQDGNLAGWLVHPKLEAPFKVRSLSELVLSLNDLLKQEDVLIGCRAKESYRTDENEVLATLRIQILFQEHYTWQGCLLWEERSIKIAFHSVLELIQILDEFLAE